MREGVVVPQQNSCEPHSMSQRAGSWGDIGQAVRRRVQPLAVHGRQLRNRTILKYRYAMHRHRPRIRLFILSEPRTGSNLLIDYLRSIPGVFAQEEILNHRAPYGLRRFWMPCGAALRHIDYSTNYDADIVTAKLMLHQLRWHGVSAEALVRRYDNARFVILYRQDLARQYISARILMLTHRDRLRDENDRFTGTLRLTAEDFCRYCEGQKRGFEELIYTSSIRRCSTLLSYEELADDPQKVFDERILPLIGRDSITIQSGMRKQTTRPMHEIIENYDELAQLLTSDTAHHQYT